MSAPNSSSSPLFSFLAWLRDSPWRWFPALLFLVALMAVSYIADGWSGVARLGFSLGGVLVLETVITAPKRLTHEFPQTVVPVYAFVVALFLAPEKVQSTEFYKAVAQILPVLLLTFVVDKRREFHAATQPIQRLPIVMVIAYLLIASYDTLQVLAADDLSLGDVNLVIGALVATVVALTLSLMTPPGEHSADDSNE